MPHNLNLILSLLSQKPTYLLSLTFNEHHQLPVFQHYSDHKFIEKNQHAISHEPQPCLYLQYF